MSEIDQTLMALGLYALISAAGSYLSCKSCSPAAEVQKNPQNPIIPQGKEAFCLVCKRSFTDDSSFQKHLTGKDHKNKLHSHRGEEFRIQNKKTTH